MDHASRVIGPLQTNVHLVADPRTREAIAIDAAIPGLAWIRDELTARGWRLILIVSTHGHWDHSAENAALQAWSREAAAEAGAAGETAVAGEAAAAPAGGGSSAQPEPGLVVADGRGGERHLHGDGGAEIAAHLADWPMLTDPKPLFAPFEVPPCVPAVELAGGGVIRFGGVRLDVLHTPGHTEGSVCLLSHEEGILFAGDTLFPGGWGRVDLPGGDAGAMVDSLGRLAELPDALRVLPGHGRETTIGRERPWLELVARERRLPF